jgi:hypothetical protein
MDKPQSAESIPASAVCAEVGQKYAARVTDHCDANTSTAVEEHTDLTLDFVRDSGEIAGQFRRDDCAATALAVSEPLQELKLRRFEACGIAGETYG